MGPKKILGLYDLWSSDKGQSKSKGKAHPSNKRNLKAPLPHPGQSYNPDPEDHKKLLDKILKAELKDLKKQATINKAMKVKVSAKELSRHEKQELESGIQHLIEQSKRKSAQDNTISTKDDSSDDTLYSDYDEKDIDAILADKKVEEKRKTKKQRLAQLRDKIQRKAAKLRKAKNVRLSKIDGVKKIMKELDKKEKEMAGKHGKKHRKTRREMLGTKFEQSDPMYCLSSELPSSLRETKCSMNAIVREQLESFQSRLMVEPTNFQIKKRKYKKRAFERGADDVGK